VSPLLGTLALAAALAVLLLLFRLPNTAAVHHAAELSTAASAFSQLLSSKADPMPALTQAVVALDLALQQLLSETDRAELTLPELAAWSQQWQTLRGTVVDPATAAAMAPAAQALARDAQRLARTVGQRLSERQNRLELWLKALVGALALGMTLLLIYLWRRNHRLRASLHQFSDGLGRGQWQDAVRTLRADRLDAPSAFDALATGVEDVLGQSDRRWQALADLAADWYWETDTRHALAWLSGSAPSVALLGWAPSEILGRRRDQLDCCQPPAGGWAALHERLDRHEPFRDLEYRIGDRARRRWIWISVSGRPRVHADGSFDGYEGVGRDITERRAAHERLLQSEQRWSLMAGLASDWYWQTDAEHRLLPLAPELLRRWGAHVDRFAGQTRWQAYADALGPAQWAEHRAELDAHMPFRSLQLEVEMQPGVWIWMSISGLPRFDGSGRFVGHHGVGRDITLRKQAERLLLRHNEELQRAVAERTRELEQVNLDLDAFARQLAHELRTPIGHVQGLAHLLELRLRDRLDAEERHLIDLQMQAAHHMRDTVDALLQLARSTTEPVEAQTVDLSALAHVVIDGLPALKRQGQIRWEIEPALQVSASPPSLRIVLTNLLGNAAKFTRHTAHASVRLSATFGADGRLRVRVQDNGAGFDPAQASRLFKPFTRLHAGEDFQGTGIGLSIVQRIVERHGGSVRAEGKVGAGALFEFTLASATPRGIAPTPTSEKLTT